MKNKKLVWLLGTLALALGLVLAGCEAESTNSSYQFSYTVTFSLGEGGGTLPATMTVEYGTRITLPGQGNMTPPEEGKTFQGWRHNDWGTEYPAGESITIGNDCTFTAIWRGKSTVTFLLGIGASGTPPETRHVDYGTPITLPGQETMTSPDGKRLLFWNSSKPLEYGNGGTTKNMFGPNESSVIIRDDCTFTAIWGTIE
jgi:hypothetical protein